MSRKRNIKRDSRRPNAKNFLVASKQQEEEEKRSGRNHYKGRVAKSSQETIQCSEYTVRRRWKEEKEGRRSRRNEDGRNRRSDWKTEEKKG